MRNFELVMANAPGIENPPVAGKCGGQPIENRETVYFEAVFVIELRGIVFSASGRGVPVESTHPENNHHPALLQGREKHP